FAGWPSPAVVALALAVVHALVARTFARRYPDAPARASGFALAAIVAFVVAVSLAIQSLFLLLPCWALAAWLAARWSAVLGSGSLRLAAAGLQVAATAVAFS